MSLYFQLKKISEQETLERKRFYHMESQKYSLVLRVRDLQKCRAFYRDTLALGNPILDSPFWVEFQMCDGGKLCLEAIDPKTVLARQESSPVWMMEADEELVEHLSAYRLSSQKTPAIMGYEVTAFRDPEGNVFYLTVSNED